MSRKIRSNIFKCILGKVCSNKTKEEFRVKNVSNCIKTSTSFLAKHSIDKNNKNKKVYGNAYFERINRGLYRIREEFYICNG